MSQLQDHSSPGLDFLKSLRSPRDILGGYVILPRLIDKIRLKSTGRLPFEYHPNLLRKCEPHNGFYPLDGRFLEFTGLDALTLEQVILEAPNDAAVLAWIDSHALPHTRQEREAWGHSFERLTPDDRRTQHRRRTYPGLAHRSDLGMLSPFDLIDMDEGRLPDTLPPASI